MQLYLARAQELAENPPADDLIAIYFKAQGWWKRPRFDGRREEEENYYTLPESTLPEFEN